MSKSQMPLIPGLPDVATPTPAPKAHKSKVDPGWSDDELILREMMRQGQAVVVSERKRGPHQNLIAWAKEQGLHTYIGRASKWTGHKQSAWHNPFKVTEDRASTLKIYRVYLESKPILLSRLSELRGHALGCWCAPGYECHGDILAEMANEADLP